MEREERREEESRMDSAPRCSAGGRKGRGEEPLFVPWRGRVRRERKGIKRGRRKEDETEAYVM